MNQISDILQDHIEDTLHGFKLPTQTTKTHVHTDESIDIENPKEKESKESIDVNQIKKTIYGIKDQLDSILRILDNKTTSRNTIQSPTAISKISLSTPENEEKIVEGVFNGEKMIGPDGQEYAMSPNYASKSKIVEGDLLKLSITREGRFIFKQIGPVPRKRVVGTLEFDSDTQLWSVRYEEKNYKILTASATFYKGKPGDEVVILLPEGNHCDWGAVENIISK